ncbi:NADH-dependent flavin oxidoreductase [Peribacillus sp. NJ11]|uniref:NADH-dependent flavin oxidoreductase n=1 Tax=Peribacillus sp. NJ11 TaxID=3055861 RepID=UPI0025A2880B|nr:NADH-dependent flavin oxidoreductase [Peribacillus sp. NJ11]MDM5224064.1 NADH-dependent flavin oxidoreductase [Peribacillus sp. NJ11]
MNQKYEKIFQPYKFPSGVEVKNRIMMAPMTTYSSDDQGFVTDDELAYYAERSAGVGAVVTACAYVSAGGKGFPGQFSADDDSFIPSLRKLAETIQSNGSKAILQIYHGGRQSPPELLPDNQPVSASAIASSEKAPVPREMSEDVIQGVIKAFGEATRRAIEAGFDGVEIHGANTYLLQQFFSPHSNRRTDNWGGTLGKRLIFPLTIVNEVEKSVAEHAEKPFIIGYRISPEEGSDPGITLDDTIQFVDRLANQNLDYLHISVGHFWNGSFRESDRTKSRIVKIYDKVGNRIPVVGVGSLHTPDEVAEAMETGVPFIALGRELLMEPHWIEKIRSGKEGEIRTTLSKKDQEELVIPDPLWEKLIHIKGWLPVVE